MTHPPPQHGKALGIGMIGPAFMGAVHSQAWRMVGQPEPGESAAANHSNHSNHSGGSRTPTSAALVALCGRDRSAVTSAAARMGWHSVETDWKALVAREDVDVVDICAPGDQHAEIAVAALDAGKHVLCEQPPVHSVAEAAAMAEAAARAAGRGVRSMLGFHHRWLPAILRARTLVASRLGAIRRVRAQYLQDRTTDSDLPPASRSDRARAGSGALGELGPHLVDLARFVTGAEFTGVAAVTETLVTQRTDAGRAAGSADVTAAPVELRRAITGDAAALFLARFSDGALGCFEVTRLAGGHRNCLRIEVNGAMGSVVFDAAAANEVAFHDHTADPRTGGFRRLRSGGPSGWEQPFVRQARAFVDDIAADRDPQPSFVDGLRVQRVLDAVGTSATNQSKWTVVEGS